MTTLLPELKLSTDLSPNPPQISPSPSPDAEFLPLPAVPYTPRRVRKHQFVMRLSSLQTKCAAIESEIAELAALTKVQPELAPTMRDGMRLRAIGDLARYFSKRLAEACDETLKKITLE